MKLKNYIGNIENIGIKKLERRNKYKKKKNKSNKRKFTRIRRTI